MKLFIGALLCTLLLSVNAFSGDLNNLPANTWVRITSSPGDPAGREVPPGRASTWIYEPNTQKFLRYGGYTPTFTNALYSFDASNNGWAVLFSHDETFPATRPGGGSGWSMAYDSSRKVVWLAGGWRSGGYTPAPYAIGDQGVWKYDPIGKTFTKLGTYIGWNTHYAFDPVHNVIVASPIAPSLDTKFGGVTYVFSLATNQWQIKSTSPLPQDAYGGGYTILFDPSIGKCVLLKGTETWAFDAGTNQWTNLTTTGTPPSGNLAAVAYDPDHQVLLRYGGSDGQYYTSAITETWVFKGATSTWTKIACPGLPQMAGALLYCLALAWDPVHHCMLLNDPDLGVWAFKYDPAQPAGTTVVDAQPLVVGQAASNPAATGPAEVKLAFPSALNPTLLNMNDNSLLYMGRLNSNGDELMWNYDADHGVCVKYGGCGNESSPYWAHYGDDLEVYDPGTGKLYTRRVGDVGGACRPGTGCTRSVVYDSKRKLWWFFGSASSGPYNPAPSGSMGPYSYDLNTDLFTDNKVSQSVDPGNPACVLSYDPDHDISIMPRAGGTFVFNFATKKWEQRTSASSPGALYGYNRTVYVNSTKKFLCLQDNGSAFETWTYDPAANVWAKPNPSGTPSYRTSKPGLAYDSLNDVVILVGGQVGWNGTALYDIWAYDVKANQWTNMNPPAGANGLPGNACMRTAYDRRHNVMLINSSEDRDLYAYRYKKTTTGISLSEAGLDLSPGLSVSPNPFGRTVTITLRNAGPSAKVAARITDIAGRTVKIFKADELQGQAGRNSALSWNASTFAPGIYLLSAQLGNKRFVQRLVLQ